VTGGSRLSFRIRPGAPTSSIDISADGDVGIGTGSPDASLHVFAGTTETAHMHVEQDALSTNAARTLMTLENIGNTSFLLTDAGTNGSSWQLGNLSNSSVDGFVISRQGDGVNEFIIKDNGDVFINNGTVQVTSSRASKENFSTPDPEQLLATLSALPVTMWNYKKDGTAVRHMGPVAEDFYAAFGLGTDDKHVSHGDTSGVALAGVQALHSALQNRDARITQLEAQLEALRLQVEKLAN
jgi:hypothetical protein